MDKRFAGGVSIGVAYTFSKANGDGEAGGNEGVAFQDPRNRAASKGLFRFDQTHVFVAHYVWELPGAHMRGPLRYVLGGWQSNGILSLRTGFPFTVTEGTGDLNIGSGPARPDRIKDGRLSDPTRVLAYDPTAFQRATCNIPSRPDLCHYGTSGVGIVRDRGQRNLDFSLFKNFNVTEQMKLQFRGEAFNAFNTPYFNDPNNIGFSTINWITPDVPRVGEIRSLRTSMRIVQFGLKLFFYTGNQEPTPRGAPSHLRARIAREPFQLLSYVSAGANRTHHDPIARRRRRALSQQTRPARPDRDRAADS